MDKISDFIGKFVMLHPHQYEFLLNLPLFRNNAMNWKKRLSKHTGDKK